MQRTVVFGGTVSFLAAFAGIIAALALTGYRSVEAQGDLPPRAGELTVAERAITLEAANTMITAAVARAREMGLEVSVVVVDAHGLQRAMVRMDGALPSSVNVAHAKAYTAAIRQETTEDYGNNLTENPRLLHSIAAVQPHMFLTPGGLPIIVDGQVVGAIGAGGAARGADLPIATAGLAAVQLDAGPGIIRR